MRGKDARRPGAACGFAPRRAASTAIFSFIFYSCALIALSSLSGCDKTSAPKTSPDGSAAAPAEVRVGYFGNLTHAQAVLGVSSGDFEKAVAPAKLKPRVFNAGPSLVEALFGGEIDVGYVGPGPVLGAHARSEGQGSRGIRVISGAAANGVLVVARKDSGITSFKDLAGKRLATPQLGNTQDIAARHYLWEQAGKGDVKEATRKILPVQNAEQSGLMLRGEIDAAWAPEPWGSRLVAEAGATVVGEEKDLWPGKEFSLTVVVTTPQFLRDHADVVEKLLNVHRRWTDRLTKEPGKYEAQLEAALGEVNHKPLPPGLLRSSLPRVKFTDEPLEATFQTMGGWSYDLGFAHQPVKLDNLFDLSILRKLEKSPETRNPAGSVP